MRRILYILIALCLVACDNSPRDVKKTGTQPNIFPDYIGVTIPANIAPMNFDFLGDYDRVDLVIKGEQGGELHVNGREVDIPIKEWHKLTEQNRGAALLFVLSVRNNGKWAEYQPFAMYVSTTDLDEWGDTYRRIPPGFEVYGHLGIYQRDLRTFEETPIIETYSAPGACYNCHTANRTNPEQFTFHVRGDHGATFVRHDGEDEWLKAINDSIGGTLVYPYWHPSGKYVAYSTNTTRQSFHALKEKRIEVYDQASDVLIYEPSTHRILRDTLVATTDHFETYPVFSPDGRTIYFCSTDMRDMPREYLDMHYNICRVGFDPERFEIVGPVDTIYNARAMGQTAIHPRPSYDGKWLMFTQADYGCFPIWHKEADNYLLDLQTLEAIPLTEANSDDTESWHNWSVDNTWFLFTSRRGDGLFTRLYFSSIDVEGNSTKAFLMPQRHPRKYYENMLYSYNTPDFTSAPVKFDKREASRAILSDERVKTEVK